MNSDKKMQETVTLLGELTSTISPVRILFVASMDQEEKNKNQNTAYILPYPKKTPKLSQQLSQLNLHLSVLKLYHKLT